MSNCKDLQKKSIHPLQLRSLDDLYKTHLRSPVASLTLVSSKYHPFRLTIWEFGSWISASKPKRMKHVYLIKRGHLKLDVRYITASDVLRRNPCFADTITSTSNDNSLNPAANHNPPQYYF